MGGARQLPVIPGVTNFTVANNGDFLAALAAFKRDASVIPKILHAGDSITAGFGAGGGVGWTGARAATCWLAQYVALMNAAAIPAIAQNVIGDGNASVEFANYLTPWVAARSGSTLNSLGGSGLWGFTSGNPGPQTFTGATAGDGAWVMWDQYTAAGNIRFEASFDGFVTSAGQYGSPGNAGVLNQFVPNPGAPSAALSLRRVSGTAVQIQGVEIINTVTPQIRVLNCGQGSTDTVDWTNTSTVYAKGNSYWNQGAQLVVIMLGTNDRFANPDPTGMVSRLATMCANIKANGGTPWVIQPPPGGNVTNAVVQAYRAAIAAQMAVSATTCIDILNVYQTNTDWQNQGFMFDSVHPNAAGCAYIAAFVMLCIQACWNYV